MARPFKQPVEQAAMFPDSMDTVDPRSQVLAQIETVEDVLLRLHNALKSLDLLPDSMAWVVRLSDPVPIYRGVSLTLKL